MHTLALLATALAPLAIAAPTPAAYSANEAKNWEWSVTDYRGGCSPAACTFGFNISAPTGPNSEPAFRTSCEGNSLENNGNYVYCSPLSAKAPVKARLGEATYGPPTGYNMSIVVTYAFEMGLGSDKFMQYNYTGEGTAPYGRGSPGPQSLTVKPANVSTQAV